MENDVFAGKLGGSHCVDLQHNLGMTSCVLRLRGSSNWTFLSGGGNRRAWAEFAAGFRHSRLGISPAAAAPAAAVGPSLRFKSENQVQRLAD